MKEAWKERKSLANRRQKKRGLVTDMVLLESSTKWKEDSNLPPSPPLETTTQPSKQKIDKRLNDTYLETMTIKNRSKEDIER